VVGVLTLKWLMIKLWSPIVTAGQREAPLPVRVCVFNSSTPIRHKQCAQKERFIVGCGKVHASKT